MIPHLNISRARLAFILGGLAMFGPFSIDTVFPAFLVMADDLGVGKVAMQQTISVYLIGYAAMSLFHGPISDAIGRKKVLLAGIVVFTLASVGAALATDMATMLAYRAVQGLSAGVGLIVGRAVVRDCLQGDDAQRLMSQISMIFGIAPAIAPVIGGWILGFSDWHGIFWFLALFGLVLLALTAWGLPETHPPENRVPLHAVTLARDYGGMLSNRSFRLLTLAGTANFGALFLYIASAPAFVMDLLHLDEQQFAWLFLPTIGGMVLGAFLSGRAAGRIEGTRLVRIGYACMAVAMVANVGYNAWAGDAIRVPWAVLPMMLAALGVALVFPILTLAILDMYPRQRGAASSLQAFSNLVVNAIIAGVLSPLLSHHGLHLALGMAGFVLLGWLMWQWEALASRRQPVCPREPVALQPTDQL